ncbi:MAG: PAS domain S-box protein [Syntrophorhabdus aromaticivorans]|uniref:histidine kinase n=1 Tax=Syntrophorhabdus aromaticivorans TaxID=328301 RepID=A0A971M7L4_9BACT|nr:PAS domain S-box protein [Syntrophorhabdus aromaticivorans]
MKDKNKTKSQLINELTAIRKRIAEVEKLQTGGNLSREAIHNPEHELRERTKELNCLYDIAEIMHRPDSTLEKIFQSTVKLLPGALQYPGIACSRIIRGTQEFRTDNFKETPFKHPSRIIVQGSHIGTVEVFYLEKSPECEEGPFLKEERSLIEIITRILGTFIGQKTTEEAIRKSEEKYRSIFENAIEGIFQTTPEGRMISVNPSYVEMFGYSSQEELIDGVANVGTDIYANPDDRIRFKKLMGELGVVQRFEFPALKKDGTRIWVSLSARAVKDERGTVLYYEGTIEDITSLKEAKEALLKSEEGYRNIYDNAMMGIFQSTPKGRYLRVNPALAAIHGFTSPEEMVRTVTNIGEQLYVNPKDRERYMELLEKADMVRGFEAQLRRKDGSTTWISMNARVIRDKDGSLLYYEGIVEDIARRKEAEEKLRKSQETLRAAVDATHDSLVMIDRDGKVLLSNTVGAKRLGKSVSDFIGTCIYDHFPPHVSRSRKEWFDKTFATGKPVHFEDVRHGRSFEIYCHPVLGERHEVSRVVVFARDIVERKLSEEALKRSEEKYRSIFENAIEGIFQTTPEGRMISVNPSYVEMFGYSSQEELIDGVANVGTDIYANPDDRIRFKKLMGELGVVQRFEFPALKKDGTRIWVSLSARAAKDERGTVLYYEGTIEDITKHRIAEEELNKRSEAMAASIDGITILNQDEVLIYANNAHVKTYGYNTPHELLGKSWRVFYNSNETERFEKEIMPKFRAEGKWRGEAIGRKKDGSEFPQDLSLTALENGGLIGVVRNITDRKKAEEELRITHQRLFDIIEFLPDATFVIDEKKRVVAWNLACEEMTGIKKEEMVGKSDYAIPFYGKKRSILIDYVTMDSDELYQRYESIRRKGHLLYAETFAPMIHNGKGAVLSGNASPLFDRTGKVVGAIESMRDITEVKRLEAQLRQAQKMESVGTLAGGIAHDFNNILTTLIGYATIIQMKMGKNNPLRSHVDQILSASQKAADLTRSLLTFSREQPVSLIPLDINNTIKAAKKLLKRLLTEDIELRTSLTKDDTVVMADKSQMDQILFNLVTNARDAMPKGGMLTIQTGITAMDKEFTRIHGFGEPGRYVLISVSDTGTGMDEATRDKIFDPFFTTKETGKGTGLGLTTVYGIIKQHNGHITVYSEPKQGTTFRIYLPAADTRAGRETNTEPFVSTGNETILIAEDNEGVRHVMREALQEYGYKTIEAIDGEDAINKFRQHRDIDLIIVDSVMPKKNGCEVYGEIRKINSHIKVLFTSGHTKDIVLNKGIEDGEFDFIAKPLLFNEFLQKVREVLDR